MKKFFGIIMIVIAFTIMPILNIVVAANTIPTVSIYPPSSSEVRVGGSVSYRIVANNATSFNVSSSDIGLAKGVSANISIENVNNNEKLVVLSNISGNVGTSGYIAIKAGVAQNSSVSSKTTPASPAFTIIAAENIISTPIQTPTTIPSTSNNNENNTDNNTDNNNESVNEDENKTNNENTDIESPAISISKASSTSVKAGEEIVFTVDYVDNVGVESITLRESDITLYGFTAKITVSGDGNSRKITLSNIQGNLGGLKYIVITKGTAIDKTGNKVKDDTKSGYFKLIDDSTISKSDDWIQNPNTGR